MADTTYTVLKNFILAKLQAIAQLGQAVDNPAMNFDTYPAAVIVPAEGQSDWETNAEDERIYAFEIFLYDETKKQGISTAIDTLMDATDYVLDSFAQDKLFTGITMPTGKILLNIEPVASGWGEIQDKELLAATIKIRCRVSVTNS